MTIVAAVAVLAGPAVAAPLDLRVEAGKFDEHCLKLAAGAELTYRFKAGAPVDFNIHHHRGNDVLYPVRREQVRKLAGRFRAQSDDDYCLMWENKGAQPVTVRGMVRP